MDIKIYSFIVRIWNEAVGDRESVWRGSIEKVGNDRKLYFSHLDGMVRFIQDQVGFEPLGKIKIWDSLLQWIKDVIIRN